ncbi:MAG: diguanylate cyclase [Anaerolineales bacterium]|nr:diguanylate cyclase [Anaerolineales bacterium]
MQKNQPLTEKVRHSTLIGEGEFYRLLYEHSIDAILLTSPDGRILAANPAACAMFGRTEDEIKAIGRKGVVDASDPRLAEIVKQREATGHAKGELIGIRKDGSKFPIEFTSSIFKDQNGELRTSMIIRDISERKSLEIRLQEQMERLHNITASLPDAIYTFNLSEQKTTSFNRDSFLGYSYEELNKPGYLLAQIHPEDAAKASTYWQDVMRNDSPESFEYRLRNKAGQWEWVDSRTSSLTRNPDGTPREIMVILRVITDRKKAEELFAYHANILGNVNDVIIDTDENFNIRYWNHAAERTFGWKAEEVIGKPAAEVLRTTFSEGEREESIRQISQTGIWKGEVTQFTKDGRAVFIDANIMLVKDQTGKVTGYVTANRDISKRKQMEEKLYQSMAAIEAANFELQQALEREQNLARTDGLTGLFNRRHFFTLAEHEFKVAKRYNSALSITIFDLDHFKHVNDRWGHQVGDEVLKHISKIVQSQLRESDILARYGGEEFILLMPNSNAKEAEHVAERIRSSITAYRIHQTNTVQRITVSMGVAALTAEMDSLDHLIRHADSVLYKAKESGRDCVKVYPTNAAK